MSTINEIARPLNLKQGELMDSVLSNEYLYDLAGITKEHRGELLRLAFDVARKHLLAKARKVFQFQGQLIYSRLLPDLVTQSRAIDHAKDMAGLSQKDTPKIEMKVTVNLPTYMTSADIPPPRDITPSNHEAPNDT